MRLKDKNRPKSPLSGFACFVQVIRDKHRTLHPDKNIIFSEFSKKCAELWRVMPPNKRAPFEEMSKIDTKRYNREMGEYVQQQQLTPQNSMGSVNSQSLNQSGYDGPHHYHTMRGGGVKRMRRLKDPAMPKRALSAFFFFCDQQRPQIRSAHPEWRVSEIAKELGRLWDECTDKAPFERQAQSDKLRYEEEMRQYKAGTFVLNPKRMRGNHGISSINASSSSANASTSANCFEIEGSREVDEMDGHDYEDEEEEEEDSGEEEFEDDENAEDVERSARGVTHEGMGLGPEMSKGGNGEPTQSNANKGGTEFEKMEQEEEGGSEEEEGSEDELIVEDEELEEKIKNVKKMTKGKNQDKDAEEISRPQIESHQRQGSNAFSVASVVSGGIEGKNEGGDIGAGSSPTRDENTVENEEEEEGQL
ncbi:unnamed protein product [Hymenolepis diminuta]|nr:unnamed protein product [Hymenolepis diminuta]VUZ45476.1 unnamed protein product [Hymenolepis diminuta]